MKKGILKSEKYTKLARNARFAKIALMAVGSVIGVVGTVPAGAITSVNLSNFKDSIAQTAQYQTYVQEKSNEYLEDLNSGDITHIEYLEKVKELSDIGGYLKSDAPEQQMAEYKNLQKLNFSYTMAFGGFGIGLLLMSGAPLAVECVADIKREKNMLKEDETFEEEMQ